MRSNGVRRAAAAGSIGVLAVSVGGIGAAAAANGGSLVLGHRNGATRTTALVNSHGTPLSLRAGRHKAPLSVNSSTKVRHLNSDLLDGASAAGLATSGSGASTNFQNGHRGLLKGTPTLVATTGRLAKGTYYVTATATLFIESPATGGFCFLSTSGPNGQAVGDENGEDRTGFITASEVAVMAVRGGQKIASFCSTETSAASASEIAHAGVLAIRIAHAVPGKAVKGVRVG